jgi:hypothetical protein
MSDSRDDFSSGVRKILAHRAGFHCSRPSCRALTAGPSDESAEARTDIGVAAHITAASPGGARYDPNLTPEERRSINNGIWLCQIHGKEVDDDQTRFTVEILRAWKRQAEEDARAMLGRPISAQSLDVSIEVVLHRDLDDSLLVTGSTNLPDGTKLWVELCEPATGRNLGQAKTTVSQGMLAASGFKEGNMPHPHGWCVVQILAYFNGPWQQPDAVVDIVGREGEHLVGRFAEPLHPEFSESEKRFRAAFDCVAPLLTGTPARTREDLQRAIEIARDAALVVDGRKSAAPTRGVVDLFMSSPGLRPYQGWSAHALPNGAVVVIFSFWNADQPAVAEWTVILDTKDVRYRNLHAKYMSWIPDS